MSASVCYWLPWPVTVNAYYRSTPGGVKISSRGRAFANEVESCVHEQGGMRLSCRVSLRVELYPQTRRKYDADNVLKSLLDSLEKAGVLENDEQVWDLRVIKHDKEDGVCGARVTITPI